MQALNPFKNNDIPVKVKISHIWLWITILVIISAGASLRFYHLGEQSYWMDEGYTVNAIMSVSEHGNTILDSGKNYSCATYCYPTAYFVKLFGADPFSYRLLAVLAGILFLIAVFFILKKLFTKKIALLSTFFLTFSYWQIAWSRQARWYTLFTLFFWLALFFFYQSLYSAKTLETKKFSLRNNRYFNIILTLIFTYLAILTHGLGYLLPLIFIGWILIDQIFIQKKINWQKSSLIIFVGLIVLYFISLKLNLKLHYLLPYYLSFYLRNYWLFFIPLLIALFAKDYLYKKQIYFLLFPLVSYLVGLSFFTDIVHYRYLFHLTPVLIIIGTIGLLNLHQDIPSKSGRFVLWFAVLGLFFTVGGGVFWPTSTYYLESDNFNTLNRPYYASTPQPDWNAAYGFIKSSEEKSQRELSERLGNPLSGESSLGFLISKNIIISSHPHFNKIFLGEAGYWLKYNYLGFDNTPSYTKDDREYYVGAKIIDDLAELKTILATNHGYIVFDSMADERIAADIMDYIKTNLTLAFHDKINFYSEVWVYKF